MNEEISKYLKFSISGLLSQGFTQGLITPIDLVKCRIQTGGYKYPSLSIGLRDIIKEEGMKGIFRGFIPTTFGYSLYGFIKFGTYEMINRNSNLGPMTLIYSCVVSDIISSFALCPFESIKVRQQTNPQFSQNLIHCVKKIYNEEYYYGFYKAYIPLLLRQLPFTIIQFTTFEQIFKKLKESPEKDDFFQYSIASGFLYGIICTTLTNPSDIVISKVNRTSKTTFEIIPKIGWRNYLKGFKQRLIILGILTSLQMSIYELFLNL